VFRQGETLERYFETDAGILWLSARVSMRGKTLSLNDVLLYPATSSALQVGVADVLQIVSGLRQEALNQGFESYTIKAERVYGNKPARMINHSKKLR
jgi:hypothetical protein